MKIPFRKTAAMVLLSAATATSTTTCSDAETVATDIKVQADSFQLVREITFYNTRSDRITFHLIANFSIEMDEQDNQAEITCMTGENEYQRILLHLNDDTIYSVTNFAPEDDMYLYTFELDDFADCIAATEQLESENATK